MSTMDPRRRMSSPAAARSQPTDSRLPPTEGIGSDELVLGTPPLPNKKAKHWNQSPLPPTPRNDQQDIFAPSGLLIPRMPSLYPVMTPPPVYKDIDVCPDSFFRSHKVYSLNVFNSREFLMDKTAALVLFYCPHDESIEDIGQHFVRAACSTKRENHAFATVNCTLEPDLCTAYGVTLTPFLCQYSKGMKINSGLVDPEVFREQDIRLYIEQAPAPKCVTPRPLEIIGLNSAVQSPSTVSEGREEYTTEA